MLKLMGKFKLCLSKPVVNTVICVGQTSHVVNFLTLPLTYSHQLLSLKENIFYVGIVG